MALQIGYPWMPLKIQWLILAYYQFPEMTIIGVYPIFRQIHIHIYIYIIYIDCGILSDRQLEHVMNC